MKQTLKEYFDFYINAVFQINKDEIVRLIGQIHFMDTSLEISWVDTMETLKYQEPIEVLDNLDALLEILDDMEGEMVDQLQSRVQGLYCTLSNLVIGHPEHKDRAYE